MVAGGVMSSVHRYPAQRQKTSSKARFKNLVILDQLQLENRGLGS